MRTIAALIMTSSLAVLIWVMHEALVISVSHPPGLTNPTRHFGLNPEFRDILFAMLLVAAISAYCFATIAWTEQKLDEIRCLMGHAPTTSAVRQPLQVRLLKDAIRSGDAAAVRRYARRSAFDVIDDHYLTPLELADLYENQPVLDALRSEMLRHARQKAAPGKPIVRPSSPFALRQPARSKP